MGGKQTKNNDKPIEVRDHKKSLTRKDYKFFKDQTGLDKDEIDLFFNIFMEDSPTGQMTKESFAKLYPVLRIEPSGRLDEITQYVFRAFDKDHSGTLSFAEFLIGWCLTCDGPDIKTRLEYAFEMYDADNNGYLDSKELRAVIPAMLQLLGAKNKGYDPNQIAAQAINQLDVNHDRKIDKDEFINGLLDNYELKSLLSPFN